MTNSSLEKYTCKELQEKYRQVYLHNENCVKDHIQTLVSKTLDDLNTAVADGINRVIVYSCDIKFPLTENTHNYSWIVHEFTERLNKLGFIVYTHIGDTIQVEVPLPSSLSSLFH